MTLELTPEGEQAYRILRWAQEDPAGRAVQAVRQVGDLARPLLGTSSQALRDVQDAGTVLARLADSLTAGVSAGEVPLTSGNTISGLFLSGDLSTISGQVDLGWEAALHPRGAHGRFARSGSTGVHPRAPGSPQGRIEHDRQMTADAREATPEEFSARFGSAFSGSPYRAFVNHYTPQEMRDGHMTPILAAGGKAGVLIRPHGDGRIEPTALFNTSDRKGMGLALLRMAIEKHRANYVECFGPALPKMYGTLGFKDEDVYPFDPAEAPAGWDSGRFDSPDYHTMNLAVKGEQVIAAATDDEGINLDEIRRQSDCTDDEWHAALAVFGIIPPSGEPGGETPGSAE